MIAPDVAWDRIAAHLAPLPVERVARRAAHGRVLALPLRATTDLPAADVSAMDGFAVAGEIAAGSRLAVAATLFAGDTPGRELPPGQAMRIMTGAPIPLGADRVVPIEVTRAAPGDTVEILVGTAAGEHVRRRGEVQRAGDVMLPAGARLTAGALALAATHGWAELPVHRLPAVAVLATGDEVVPPDQEPAPGQLRDSHTDFLLAAGASLGLRFTPLGIAPDRRDALTELVRRGLASADVLIICGGVSMGELDLVEGVLASLGCDRHLDAVAVQPGKPLVFATDPGGVAIFGLPGNPASVLVDFWLFVRPALARLAGRDDSWWQPALPGVLAGPLPAAPANRDRFLAAEVSWGAAPDGAPLVHPLGARGSHDLAAYARGTALVRIRAGAPAAPAGARCEILPLPPL